MRDVVLPFGSAPLTVRLPDAGEGVDLRVVEPPTTAAAPLDQGAVLAVAASQAVSAFNRRGTRVALILSDASRDEPRSALYHAVRQKLEAIADSDITLCVANGTHAPRPLATLGLPDEILRRHPVYNHDGTDEAALVDLGATQRGTRIVVARVAAEADLVVATGRIRPHYFAGYGGGSKAIFPGIGKNGEIRRNHELKADPTSRLGRVAGNACRDDLAEAARCVGAARRLLNVVQTDRQLVAAVGGDLDEAFARGVTAARPLHEVPRPFPDGADVVLASDRSPVTDSLYQACKVLPPAGLCLAAGGRVVVAAACSQGTGPLETVMENIWSLGVRHYLPPPQAVTLVSTLPADVVARTFALASRSVEAAIASALRSSRRDHPRLLVLPRASELVPVEPQTP